MGSSEANVSSYYWHPMYVSRAYSLAGLWGLLIARMYYIIALCAQQEILQPISSLVSLPRGRTPEIVDLATLASTDPGCMGNRAKAR